MVNLWQALGLRTHFLRYNPDKCDGTPTTEGQRRATLLRWVNWMTTSLGDSDTACDVRYLFFDGWDGTVEPIPFRV
jgi:hypothetical protein